MKSGTFETLNENHELFSLLKQNPSWWKTLKKDSDLYIAVRKDNYLNVYYQDGCLAKIFLSEDGSLMISCHRAYLCGIEAKAFDGDYLDITDSFVCNSRTLDVVKRIKSNISAFYKNESIEGKGTRISEKYIQWEWAISHPYDIIDLEFAFYKRRKKVRIDIAQVVSGKIVFVELKRITDYRLLRDDLSEEPGIIDQMRNYQRFIQDNKSELLSYYQKIHRIKKSLGVKVSYQPPEDISEKPLLSIANTYPFINQRRYERIGLYDKEVRGFTTGMMKHITEHSSIFDYEIFQRLHRTIHLLKWYYKNSERKKDLNSSIHGKENNLFEGIRDEAIIYFKDNNISWWKQGKEDGKHPTTHCLSSQIHCLNHLMGIRKNHDAVLAMIRRAIPEIEFQMVLKVPIDSPSTQGYIAFEFTYNNKVLLSEDYDSRGTSCTSIDAIVYAQDISGKKWLIPIEWKYTEQQYDGSEAYAGSILRYPSFVTKRSNLKTWDILYRIDPYYELARQTLLIEQLAHSKDTFFPVDDYRHILVCPKENPLRDEIERNYLPTLKDSSNFKIISPKELTESLLPPDVENYLQKRYW